MKFHFYIHEESRKQYLQNIFSSLRHVLCAERHLRLKTLRKAWDSLHIEKLTRNHLKLCDSKFVKIQNQLNRNRLEKAFLSFKINSESCKMILCQNTISELNPLKVEAEQNLQDEIDHTEHERLHNAFS